MAVRRHDVVAPDAGDHVRDELGELLGHAEPDGVGDVDRRRAVVDGDLAHLAHEIFVRPAAVLGRELHVVAVTLRPGDARRRFVLDLVLGHAKLLLHVDRGRRDEDVDARTLGVPHRFPRPVDVLEAGARQARDRRPPHTLGDGLDGVEVALARDREARFDDVGAEARQLLGDLELLAHVQRDAGRLLAVPQRGVEDPYLVHRSPRSVSWSFQLVLGNEKPPRPEGTRRRPRAPKGARN